MKPRMELSLSLLYRQAIDEFMMKICFSLPVYYTGSDAQTPTRAETLDLVGKPSEIGLPALYDRWTRKCMQQRGAHEARDDGVEPETHRAYGASVEDISSILVRNVFASAKIPLFHYHLNCPCE